MSIAAKCVCGGAIGFCNGKGNDRFPCVYRQDIRISFEDTLRREKGREFELVKDICGPQWNIPKGSVFVQRSGGSKDSAYSFGTYHLHPSYVENNPEWFEEKINKITIRNLKQHDNFNGNYADTFWYQFSASKELSIEKFTAIERAIENSLNIDYNRLMIEAMSMTLDVNKMFTAKDIDDAERRAFEACKRLILADAKPQDYPTFDEDYKQVDV